jgi:pimeloyl-ACP methyl ester carboxylesterase
MKPTLILLSGLVYDSTVWAPQIQVLSTHMECHVIDYGLLNSIGAMTQHELDSVPTPVFALAGYSEGGRMALKVVRRVPQRVRHLALLDIGTHPLLPGEVGAPGREPGACCCCTQPSAKVCSVMAELRVRPMMHASRRDTPLFDAVLAILERSSAAQYTAQINALLSRPDAVPVLASIQCPALVLTWRQDLWSPPSNIRSSPRKLRGHNFVFLNSAVICPHWSSQRQ